MANTATKGDVVRIYTKNFLRMPTPAEVLVHVGKTDLTRLEDWAKAESASELQRQRDAKAKTESAPVAEIKEEKVLGVPVSEVIAKGPAYKIFEDKAVRNAARRIAIKEERIKGIKAMATGAIIKETIKGLPRATGKVAKAAGNLLKKLPYFEEWPEKK